MNINKLKKDFIWYSIGAAIPMIINLIKIPIFTRYFSPTDYGYFTLINTTYSYINLFAFSWLLSCVWRYYIHEKNNKELNKFYNNILALFLIALFIAGIVTLVWVTFANNNLIKKLIIANYINVITTAITAIYLIIIRLDGKSLSYNLCTMITSIGSLIIVFCLMFLFNNSIDAILNCNNIINVIFIIYIIYKFNANYKINTDDISKELLFKLIKYGFVTVFFNMSLLLLTSGDRYIIKIFYPTDKVGIYSQVYGLAQISIIALSNILNNIINPYQFKLFEEDINNENEFYNYVVLYIICILPFTMYFSIYSKQIADLLLGEKFRSGYKMMPFIMISCFLFGLSDMHATRMKFKNKLENICINVIIACLINIVLNFIFIPSWGYECAAVTTLISYIILFCMDFYFDFSAKDDFINIFKNKVRLVAPLFFVLLVQILTHYILINKFYYCTTITYSIIEGSIFISLYVIFIYYRFKEKIKSYKNKINN